MVNESAPPSGEVAALIERLRAALRHRNEGYSLREIDAYAIVDAIDALARLSAPVPINDAAEKGGIQSVPRALTGSSAPVPAAPDSKYYALIERFAPEKWRCTKCGCLWRLNGPFPGQYLKGERSWSLFDGEQKSCAVCDNSPEFLSVIEPAAPVPDKEK